MAMTQTDASISQKPLRIWPGIVAVVLQWLLWLIVPTVAPDAAAVGMLGGMACGVIVLVWWLGFSRAPWLERVGVVVLMFVAIVATKRFVHRSIAGGGMGMLLYFYAIPVLSLALVTATTVGRRMRGAPRCATITSAILLACAAFTILRTGGITGEGDSDFHWRWTQTSEERLLAKAGAEYEQEVKSTALPGSEPNPGADWPGFRGPGRDDIVRGTRIETNWSASPPVELWRRPIGPAWSSFAVRGDALYTQEQRGEDEVVSCYQVATGELVWTHRDGARFWESNGGAGPRATPTLGQGRLYSLGATGIVNALDAKDGSVIWSRNASSDTGAKVPYWGFAGSPLKVEDMVIIAASGRLVAYDAANGDLRWRGPTGGGGGYASPHLATLDGVGQVLLLKGGGIVSVAPTDGSLIWELSWQPGGVGILQPALTANGEILITAADEMGGIGIRRLAVTHDSTGWSATERWTSRGLKPYFSDFVIHQGHAFGFDGSILACIDLSDGTRKWKGGRYGSGQLILVADQSLLLVLSEEGELALVGAGPDQFHELARFRALEGKTWNHPILVGDTLLVRNSEEMAAFRLAQTQ